MPDPLSPSTFYSTYLSHIRRLGSWSAYGAKNVGPWTKIATLAAIATCHDLGLQTTTEYYRLDVLGYTSRTDDPCDWDLRVAFEVENGAHWRDELCKLTFLAPDLCVLAAYQLHKTRRAEDLLRDEFLPRYADRVRRVPHRQWLFIFGPHWDNQFDPWTAYTLDAHLTLSPVPCPTPLRGIDLAGSRPPLPADAPTD